MALGNLFTYTKLRDFLDRYTNDDGVIQGDPATIAGEAATLGLVEKDNHFHQQIEDNNHVAAQVAEDTCTEHGVFCCPICFNTEV